MFRIVNGGELLLPEIAVAVFTHSPDAIVIVDEGGIIRFVNKQAEFVFGYTAGQLAGQPINILVPEAKRPQHDKDCMKFIETPRTRSMAYGKQLNARHRSGREFGVEINLSPVATVRGTYVLATVRKTKGVDE